MQKSMLLVTGGLVLWFAGACATAPSVPATPSSADITETRLAQISMTATALCEDGIPEPAAYLVFGSPTPPPTPVGGYTPSPTPLPGDADRGHVLFTGEAACAACHSTGDNTWTVGPSLMGIASRAGQRRANTSAQDYLRAVIRSPDENISPSVMPGLMPRTYAATLTEAQIEDIVAYLMTLT